MPEGIATQPGPDTAARSQRVSPDGFTWPEVVPWDDLGEQFIEAWGHDEHGGMRAEHMEVTGQSGSGKSYAIATILQLRAQRWDTAELAVLTKQSDDSIPLLGWPRIDDASELGKYRQAVFWPQTGATGEAREAYHEGKIYDLLTRIWQPGANLVLYFDEVRYIESLSRRLKKEIRMYWREGRSHGISIVAGAQRPVEMVRDQHSESRWKLVFPPADQGDMQRFAEMLGRWRDWQPVLESLDQPAHQFVLRNTFTKDAYITSIDRDLRPLPSQRDQKDRSVPGHISGPRKSTMGSSDRKDNG
jgi:hypothetical protein